MVKRWLVKGPHWEKKLLVNGIGAVTAAIATVIIASTKFTHGAWIVIVLIPLLISFFRAIHSHYKAVAEQVAPSRGHRPPMPRRNIVVLPIGGVTGAVIRAVDYARSRSGDIALCSSMSTRKKPPGGNSMGPVGLRRHPTVLPSPLPIRPEFAPGLSRAGAAEGPGMLGHRGDPGDFACALVAKYSSISALSC